jgi:hypothetical protein
MEKVANHINNEKSKFDNLNIIHTLSNTISGYDDVRCSHCIVNKGCADKQALCVIPVISEAGQTIPEGGRHLPVQRRHNTVQAALRFPFL